MKKMNLLSPVTRLAMIFILMLSLGFTKCQNPLLPPGWNEPIYSPVYFGAAAIQTDWLDLE